MSNNEIVKRLGWIDWMKSIGIYFIVLGHCFSVGYRFVFVFSVPLFFIISGFLSKPEKDTALFRKKILYNLIIPMLIISVINFTYVCVLSIHYDIFYYSSLIKFPLNVLTGMHSGIRECWFVYTLAIIKIIYQYYHNNKINFLLSCIFLAGAYAYNHIDLSFYPQLKEPNSIINVCTAYPFFILGTYIRNYKDKLNNLKNKLTLITVFIIGLITVYVCGKYNDHVWMFICGYGDNILLFLIGGAAGTITVFAFSKLLNNPPYFIKRISQGTILILGLHANAGDCMLKFIHYDNPDFLFALIIVIAFFPLITISEKYFPLILGKYRIKKA